MTTIRIFFEKCGESVYISLLDLQRVFHRMLKMSSLPVYYTQGFNPHIYLSFTCPLSLGQESLCESCEVKTEQETIDSQAWIDAYEETDGWADWVTDYTLIADGVEMPNVGGGYGIGRNEERWRVYIRYDLPASTEHLALVPYKGNRRRSEAESIVIR